MKRTSILTALLAATALVAVQPARAGQAPGLAFDDNFIFSRTAWRAAHQAVRRQFPAV